MGYALPPDLNKDLVLEFFWIFSVFECALKREHFLKHKEDDAPAEANWIEFANRIRGKLGTAPDRSFVGGVARLRQLAPRKQIVRNSGLAWKTQKQDAGESDEAYTIRLVTTVRNNLFHGGKYLDGDEFEVARDRDILSAALAVLNGLSCLDPDIKARFEEFAA